MLSVLNFSQVDYTQPGEIAASAFISSSVLGIFAAWARILTTRDYLMRHPVFRATVSIGLLFGVYVTASVALTNGLNPVGSVYLLNLCLFAACGALLLFLGTVSP